MQATTVRIVLLEDHVLFRSGIKQMLSAEQGFSIVGEAGSGLEGLDLVEKVQPDVVLLDITLPELSGIEVASRVKKHFPGIRILMVSMHNSIGYLRSAMQAGADGYVLKSSDVEEFMVALRAIVKGRQYICSECALHVVHSFMQGEVVVADPLASLSLREREVLILIAEGTSNKEIAGKLNLAVKTVDNHRSNIMRKLELRNLRDIIFFAIEHKLVEQS